MKRLSGNKKGYLLPMVIIYMIIAAVIGSGILVLGSFDRIETNKRLQREQAFYLAEAGTSYARFQLKTNPAWVPDPDNRTYLGAGYFHLDETITGDTVVIISTGAVKNAAMVLQLNLVAYRTGIFSSGIFASDFAEIKNEVVVYGDVGSNLRIKEDDNCKIYGSARVAPGGIIEINKGVVTGGKFYNAATRTLAAADVPDAFLPARFPLKGFTVYGDSKISVVAPSDYTLDANGNMNIADHKTVTFTGGDYRLHDFNINHDDVLAITGNSRMLITHKIMFDNGNLVINSGCTLLLYIGDEGLDLDGDIDAKGGSMVNAAGDPSALRVYAYGAKKHHVLDNSTFKALLYAPFRNEPFEFNNNTQFYGAIVCKKFKFDSKSDVFYDTSLYHKAFPESPGGSITTVTFAGWTKPNWKR